MELDRDGREKKRQNAVDALPALSRPKLRLGGDAFFFFFFLLSTSASSTWSARCNVVVGILSGCTDHSRAGVMPRVL